MGKIQPESGAALMEYVIAVAFICAVATGSVLNLGYSVHDPMINLSIAMGGGSIGAECGSLCDGDGPDGVTGTGASTSGSSSTE